MIYVDDLTADKNEAESMVRLLTELFAEVEKTNRMRFRKEFQNNWRKLHGLPMRRNKWLC